MKSIVFAAALSATALAKELPSFESFVELHARSYQQGSAEFEQRKALYHQRLANAEEHNNKAEKKWVAGVNKLWDWTANELQSLYGWDGSAMPKGHSASRGVSRHGIFLQRIDNLPKERLWDKLKTFSYVKNQADCGSCWAIASSTVLEAHNEIANGNHRTFSTQQIVDCTPNPRHCGGDGGCKGATAELAMEWVLKNGIVDAAQLPYTARDGTCTKASATADMKAALQGGAPFMRSQPAFQGGATIGMTGWSTLPKNQYEPLVRALATEGPVAVSVAASEWSMYESGIFNGCLQDAVVNHAVVAVGYGEEKKIGSPGVNKYWVIQNSWGEDWGENGMIKLERHTDGQYCGMNHDPQQGVACKGETEPVPVCGMCGVLFDSVVPHFKKVSK